MTLNILFMTITFKKRQYTLQQLQQEQYSRKIQEQHKDRQYSAHRMF